MSKSNEFTLSDRCRCHVTCQDKTNKLARHYIAMEEVHLNM